MDKDLVSALKRIRMVAQLALEQRESRDEMAKTLAYIIDEVTETFAEVKEQAA